MILKIKKNLFLFFFLSTASLMSMQILKSAVIQSTPKAEIKEEKKGSVITQSLLEKLTLSDRKILVEFKELLEGDYSEIIKIMHLLFIHYQSFEVYFTEKLITNESDDELDFHKTLDYLLKEEAKVYKTLSPRSKNLWAQFQEYLEASDRNLSFNSFKLLQKARKILCTSTNLFFNSFIQTSSYFNVSELSSLIQKENKALEETQKNFVLAATEKINAALSSASLDEEWFTRTELKFIDPLLQQDFAPQFLSLEEKSSISKHQNLSLEEYKKDSSDKILDEMNNKQIYLSFLNELRNYITTSKSFKELPAKKGFRPMSTPAKIYSSVLPSILTYKEKFMQRVIFLDSDIITTNKKVSLWRAALSSIYSDVMSLIDNHLQKIPTHKPLLNIKNQITLMQEYNKKQDALYQVLKKYKDLFKEIYPKTTLLKTMYALLYDQLYQFFTSQKQPDLSIRYGTLCTLNNTPFAQKLPEAIFVTHQIITFDDNKYQKEHIHLITHLNKFLKENLKIATVKVTRDNFKSIVTMLPQIRSELKKQFDELDKNIWGCLPNSIKFFLVDTEALWFIPITKPTQNVQELQKSFKHLNRTNALNYYIKELSAKKHALELAQQLVAQVPVSAQAEQKLEQADAEESDEEEDNGEESEVKEEEPVALKRHKITWKKMPVELYSHFFPNHLNLIEDKKAITIRHFDLYNNKIMWSKIDLEQKPSERSFENYTIEIKKIDRFHCIPDNIKQYLNRGILITSATLETVEALNTSLEHPIMQEELDPTDEVIFFPAKIAPTLDQITKTNQLGIYEGAYVFIFRDRKSRHAMFHPSQASAEFHKKQQQQ